MSYLVTIEPTRREVGIRSNCEEITPDTFNNNNNNIYKTKLDLSIINPRNGSSFPLVSTSTSEATHHDKVKVSEIISLEGDSMEVDSAKPAPALEMREEDRDAGVETKSCGKISALISHFKNVQATTRPEKVTAPKVPAKKLRMDVQGVALDNSTSTTKTIDVSSTKRDAEMSGKIPNGNASFPLARLNFKIHVEEATQLHQNRTLENKIMKENKQFPARNVITTKPLVMPRSFINNKTHCIIPQQATIQPKEISFTNHSDQVQLSPTEDATKPDHSNFIKNEVNNVQVGVQQQSPSDDASTVSHISDNAAVKNFQESDTCETDGSQGNFITKVTANSCIDPENHIVPDFTVNVVDDIEGGTETITANDFHSNGMVCFPVKERQVEENDATSKSEVPSGNCPLIVTTIKPTSATKDLKIMKQEMFEKNEELMTHEVTVTTAATSNTNNDVCGPLFKDTVTTSDPVNSEPDRNCYIPQIKVSFDNDDLVTEMSADNGSCDVNKKRASTSSPGDSPSPATEYCSVSDRINVKLDMLKSELMAMRRMDLVLLKQLINISQKMQRIQTADALKVSRSLTFLNPNKTMPRRCRPVERQNSAPHCADRRRFLFSNLRSNTEDDYRDSLSSFDESEVDSGPSEVEESTGSLNSVLTNSPRSATGRRTFFQSRDLLVSLDFAEDAEQNYEDILRRNVRLWKMSFQNHQSVEEEVDVWF